MNRQTSLPEICSFNRTKVRFCCPGCGFIRPALLTCLILITLLIRLPGLDKSIWLDEAFSLQDAYSPDFGEAIRSSDHPPLYPLLLRGWLSFGESEAFLRLPSVFFGTVTVLVLFLLLLRHNRTTAVMGALMAILSPSLLHFSQEIRGYALLLLFTALAILCANRLQHQPENRWPYLGLAFSLSGAVATHLVGVFLVPALAAYLVLSSRKFNRRSLLPLVVTFMAPVILFAIYYFLVLSPAVRTRSPAEWGFPSVTSELVVFSLLYLVGFFAWMNPLPALLPEQAVNPANPISILLVLAVLLLITSILAGNWRKGHPYLIVALVYWGGLIVYSLMFAVIINERTFMPGLIPLICFAAVQITGRFHPWRSSITFASLGILCLSGALNWLSYGATIPIEDWRSVSAIVADAYQPGDSVVLLPGYTQAAVSYYIPQIPAERVLTIALHTVRSDQQVADLEATVADQIRNAGAVFLIYRGDAAAASDSRTYPLLQAVIEKQFGPPDIWQANRITLLRYRRSDLSARIESPTSR